MADQRADVAQRYAAALFDLVLEKDALKKVEPQLARLRTAVEESADLRRLTLSPVFNAETKKAAIMAVLDKAGAHDIIRNFVGLMAENGRLAALGDTIAAFMRMAAARRGEVSAEVLSARSLTADQEKALRAQIEGAVGKSVTLQTAVDPDLLGGLVVKVGSQMIDSSLRTKLNRLRQTLKEA